MAEIEAQVRQLVKTYSCISADKQNLFQSERVIIGKCPRCSENVYEGKKEFLLRESWLSVRDVEE